jgi:hypothetical protein
LLSLRLERNITRLQFFFRHIIVPMKSVDEQLRQAKEHYARMTEGELCALAEDAYDLTEIGRQALQAVITERGFTIRLKLEPPLPSSAEPPEDHLVILGQTQSAEVAGRKMKILAEAGIPVLLSLRIRADDVERAHAALERAGEEDAEVPEEGEYTILCPKCHSAAVVLKRGDSMLADQPKFEWSCDTCAHQWEDDGTLQEVAGGQSWPGEEFPSRNEGSAKE